MNRREVVEITEEMRQVQQTPIYPQVMPNYSQSMPNYPQPPINPMVQVQPNGYPPAPVGYQVPPPSMPYGVPSAYPPPPPPPPPVANPPMPSSTAYGPVPVSWNDGYSMQV